LLNLVSASTHLTRLACGFISRYARDHAQSPSKLVRWWGYAGAILRILIEAGAKCSARQAARSALPLADLKAFVDALRVMRMARPFRKQVYLRVGKRA